jgi:hypothetical protein
VRIISIAGGLSNIAAANLVPVTLKVSVVARRGG